MTRFSRRATSLAAAFLAAPLGFALVATTGPQAVAAGAPVAVSVVSTVESAGADVVTGWINSPGHRANMLNCTSIAVGVGLAYKADGNPYWTQDFGRV